VRKKSTYIGRLDREGGLIQSSKKYRPNVYPKSVKIYGDSMLFNIALNDLIPLLKENLEFALLKRERLTWENLHNSLYINQNLKSKHLSEISVDVVQELSAY